MAQAQRTILWDEDGFVAAFAHWQAVLAAPRSARSANPMAAYFVERYGRARGLVHFRRWLKIGDFLARHIGRLQRENLVWAMADGALEMRADFITALCRVPLRRNRLVLTDVLSRVHRPRPRSRREHHRKVDRKYPNRG